MNTADQVACQHSGGNGKETQKYVKYIVQRVMSGEE